MINRYTRPRWAPSGVGNKFNIWKEIEVLACEYRAGQVHHEGGGRVDPRSRRLHRGGDR
ncbi:MAG: hypothetical protein ACLTMP_00875 [Eggerthella lenta]